MLVFLPVSETLEITVIKEPQDKLCPVYTEKTAVRLHWLIAIGLYFTLYRPT